MTEAATLRTLAYKLTNSLEQLMLLVCDGGCNPM